MTTETPPPADAPGERAVLALFEQAIEIEDARRDEWLAAHCGGDTRRLQRVQRLLAIDRAASSGVLAADGSGTELASDEPWAAVLPPSTVGVYRLDELIGSGGMGAVYKASRADGLFEQTVAIKFVRPLRGLLQVEPLVDAERRLLARMQHPGIAHILDGGSTAGGLHFLVMEFVDGRALDVHVADRRLSDRAIVQLLREVCAAVAHAHQHLVLHCDIKPANILVASDGHPKLIDFGVARIQDVIDASLPQGFTRAYTSAQRLAGEPASVSDDVYSLGRVLAEVLTGSLPDSASDLPPALDRELAAIIRKAVAPDRAQRYGSVKALDDDLGHWLARQPVSAMGSHWRYRARKLVQRHPWRVASASLALCALVGALGVITGLYQRAEGARHDAERRFDEVRALATYMLFDLDARLEATPGNTAARREMVGRSQQYLDALASSARDRPALQREVAVGLARLAEVQGVPGRPNVGEPAAAKANLLRAESILAAQARGQTGEWSWHRDMARVQYLLALMVGGRENDLAGQVTRAQHAEREALAALELAQAGANDAAAASAPARTAATGAAPRRDRAPAGVAALAELHALLTSTRLTRADALHNLDAHAQAAALKAAEEQRLFQLPAAVRDAMDFDFQTGRTALLLGDSLYYLDRKDEALQAYQRGTARFEHGLTRAPTHRRLLLGATTGYWYTSSVLAEFDRLPEALRASDEALRLSSQTLAIDPQNVEAARQRAAVRNDRAMVLAKLRRFDEAIALIEESLPEKEARAIHAPGDFEAARDVAVPLRLLAQHYRDKGDAEGACRVLARAVRTWAELDQRWGLSDFDRRNDYDVVREQAAHCRN
ncbi:MAG: serine/threonine protein kinase [Ideonella sp.]|nr:serine/threonine protein kinase [Ideonella sp.]MCC7457381.1 serine/threonine protein kinase [Nitrospira sp.]